MSAMNLTLHDLRIVHEALDAGPDLEAKTSVSVKHPGWRRTRQWFLDLTEAVCRPLGLYTGKCAVGNVLHNGCCIAGPLGAALAAGLIIARIADSALEQADQEFGRPSDPSAMAALLWSMRTKGDERRQENNNREFCQAFVAELVKEFGESHALSGAGLEQRRRLSEEYSVELGWCSFSEALTPSKGQSVDSAASLLGRESAEKKRRLDDFDSCLQAFSKQQRLSLSTGVDYTASPSAGQPRLLQLGP